jgi:Holliday junction resolvasome RuvABC endonuclease subunit
VNPVVVGIDPSLTGTGVVRVGVETVTKLIPSKGHQGDLLPDRWARISVISDLIIRLSGEVALVVIEQPAYSGTGGKHGDRDGLWWLIVNRLILTVPVLEVPPATLKKYVTGKGNADKDAVIAHVIRDYPDVQVEDNNVADAYGLAAIGRRILGDPIETKPLSKEKQAAFQVCQELYDRTYGNEEC